VNFDPSRFQNIEDHDVVLLLGDLANATKQEDHLGFLMANHGQALALLWPLIVF
jgi:hypothetical protein